MFDIFFRMKYINFTRKYYFTNYKNLKLNELNNLHDSKPLNKYFNEKLRNEVSTHHFGLLQKNGKKHSGNYQAAPPIPMLPTYY